MPSISGKSLPFINDVIDLFDLANDRSYDAEDSKRQTQSLVGTRTAHWFTRAGQNDSEVDFGATKYFPVKNADLNGQPRAFYGIAPSPSANSTIGASNSHKSNHCSFDPPIEIDDTPMTMMVWVNPEGKMFGPDYDGTNAVDIPDNMDIGGVVVRSSPSLTNTYDDPLDPVDSDAVNRQMYEDGIIKIVGNKGDTDLDLFAYSTHRNDFGNTTSRQVVPTNDSNHFYSGQQDTNGYDDWSEFGKNVIKEGEWNCIILTTRRYTGQSAYSNGELGSSINREENDGPPLYTYADAGTGYSNSSKMTQELYINGERIEEFFPGTTNKIYQECYSRFRIQGLGYPQDGSGSLDSATDENDEIYYTSDDGYHESIFSHWATPPSSASTNSRFWDGLGWYHGISPYPNSTNRNWIKTGGVKGQIGPFAMWDRHMYSWQVKEIYDHFKHTYRPNESFD